MRRPVLGSLALPILLAAPLAISRPAPQPSHLLAPLSQGETLELPAVDPDLPSPPAVLGYPLGSRFTHQSAILRYLEALATASNRVTMWSYGTTYEGRPLNLVAVSSPQNIARLEEIRRAHLRLADPTLLADSEREGLAATSPVVVWLAYGIHGNEPSSAETAMATAYLLAAARGDLGDLLSDTVVLIDPLSNPDGRERYVEAYEQRQGSEPDPHPDAAEHHEPWPGGRQNHYLIDLNRDWSWATQKETRERLAAYRAWEPQVYVDFHEMSSRSTYFFPPPSEPVLPEIDPRTVAWLDVFGQANAAAFDRRGWTFFKGESFDLFYPGYGDSYPSLRGAVGMTYEVAGGGRAGAVLHRPDGTVLNLADRIARHLTTSLATVETAAHNRRRLLEDFAATLSRAATAPVTTYLWRPDQPEARSLAQLLDLHGIRVRRLAETEELSVAQLDDGARHDRRLPAGSYAVSTGQPLGNLVRALLEPEAPLGADFVERQRHRVELHLEPEFYDITAWSLPLAFHLEMWRTEGEPIHLAPLAAGGGGIVGSGRLGYLLPPQGLASYRAAMHLARQGVGCRVALASFQIGDDRFAPGTLFIPRLGNPEDLESRMAQAAAEASVAVQRAASSATSQGISLGSEKMIAVRPVRLGLVGGPGVRPTSFGSLWFLLDRDIEAPVSRLDTRDLSRLKLGDLDVLILPDGSYDRALNDDLAGRIDSWVQDGGTLIAIGGAISWLQAHELAAIKSWEPPAPEAAGDNELTSPADPLARRPLYTPGAAVATEIRRGHPLTLGLDTPPAFLVRGRRVFLPTGDPQQDIVTVSVRSPVVAGFAWPEAEERLAGSLLVGTEKRGKGRVVLFAQDPAFRLFWRGTMPLLLDAALLLPSVEEGRHP